MAVASDPPRPIQGWATRSNQPLFLSSKENGGSTLQSTFENLFPSFMNGKGKDAAAIVFHTADLEKAIAIYGDRAYRYLHMDAGHLGQRLNLAAIRLKLGVSGIGGFFDDRVNQVLDIPQEEAVIYLTTLGRP